jgi:CBS domain containing-hemolysin-like protein
MNFVLAAVFVVVNGLFVAMEFALLTASRSEIEAQAADGRLTGRLALRSMSRLGPLLAGCQLGVTAASLGLGSVGEEAVAGVVQRLFAAVGLPKAPAHTVALVLALSIVVFVHLVAGEMVPKNVALARPEQTLLSLTIPVAGFVALFKPVIWALNQLAALGSRLVGVSPTAELRSVATSAQLGLMLQESKEGGLLDPSDHELLSGALGFMHLTSADVMVPRSQIVTVSRHSTVADIERAIDTSGHSRLLITGRGIDDVLGFLHAKDLLRIPPEGRHRPFPARMYRPTINIPPDQPLEAVLVAMTGARRHLAVVGGPERTILGILTLEDVLESIVGEIVDETDPSPA